MSKGGILILVAVCELALFLILWMGSGPNHIRNPLPTASDMEKSPSQSKTLSLPEHARNLSMSLTFSHKTDLPTAENTETSDRSNMSRDNLGTHPTQASPPELLSKELMAERGPPPLVQHSQATSCIPFMGDYNCSDSLCTEFLADPAKVRRKCGSTFTGKCHFMNGTNRSSVFLMSFPGNGNTWVRGLLEKATGICTGAIYCDGGLKRSGFNGEALTSGVVLVVKSHSTRGWPQAYQAGILLLRNPLDTFVAEWTRRHSSHTGLVDKSLFRNNPKWNDFVHGHPVISPWISYFQWLVTGLQTGRRVLVVRYEDLKSDLMTQMKRMLEFLGVPYSDEALQRRMSNDFGKFHRPHNNSTDFDHYTPEQREHVKGLVKEAIEYLKSNNNGITYGLEDYL